MPKKLKLFRIEHSTTDHIPGSVFIYTVKAANKSEAAHMFKTGCATFAKRLSPPPKWKSTKDEITQEGQP